MKVPDGVNCTMLVAYDSENRIDFQAQKALLDWYVENGVSSFFALCHSTELHYLTMEERLGMVSFCRDYADKYEENTGKKIPIIAVGTFSNTVDEQAEEIEAVSKAGADAIVLITNRLDPDQLGTEEWISRGEALLKKIPSDITLGMYECPQPYKRVLTDEEIRWAANTGRIAFLKDTCCDPDMLLRRLNITKGTPLKLFNANVQTLLMTLKEGSAGYSSVMANVTPKLYVWLTKNYTRYPEIAEKLQDVLCFTAFAELLSYPLCAKYALQKKGIPIQVSTRMEGVSPLTNYQKFVMDQLIDLEERIWKELPDTTVL